MGEMTILHYEGARTVTWNMGNEEEIDIARSQFNALLEKGFSALRLNAGEEGGRKIDQFDVRAEKILMFPILIGGG